MADRKVRFTLVVDPQGKPVCDPLTGAQWAEFDVTVGRDPVLGEDGKQVMVLSEKTGKMEGKTKPRLVKGRKRIFTDVTQVGYLPDDVLCDMVNYSEDLWVRGEVTRSVAPKGEVKANRAAACVHMVENAPDEYLQMAKDAKGDQKVMDGILDAYHLAHCDKGASPA